MFNAVSYILGRVSGIATGTGRVVLENGLICSDDGEGNITIIDAQRTFNLDGNITVTDDGQGNITVTED